MKINSQEILLVNKNMKFGNTPTAPTKEENTSDSPVSTPESTLNALDLQGRNNIAFQGANKSLLQKMRNLPKAAALAMMLAVATTSCMKQEQYTDVDTSELAKMLSEAIVKPITDNQIKTNELLMRLIELINEGHILSSEQSALLSQVVIYLQNIAQNDEAARALLNSILEKLEENLEQNKQADKATIDLLNKIAANQYKYGEETKALLTTLIKKIDTLDATVKTELAKVIAKMDSLGDEQKKTLNSILNTLNTSNKLSAKNNEMLAIVIKQLGQLDKNDKISNDILNKIWQTIEKSCKEAKDMDEKTHSLLKAILENIQNFSKENKESIMLLIESVKNLDASTANAFAKLFDKLDNIGNDGQKLLNEILNEVINNKNISSKNSEILSAILNAMGNIKEDSNPEILDMLKNIWITQQQHMQQDKEMDTKTHALLKELIAKSDKLSDEQIRLLNVVIKNQEKLSAQSKESTDKLLEAINNNTEVAKGTHVLVGAIFDKMDKLGDKADQIIDAIANISTGGNVDLSKVESMLADILAQEKTNGDILTSADAKAALVLVSLNGIKNAIQDGDKATQDKIQEVIDNMPESCKCDAKLEVIIEKLQKIIDNGKNDESIKGELEDLEDMFQ